MRRRDYERFGLARLHRRIQPGDKLFQETALALLVPVGLLHGGAGFAHGRNGAARRVGALLAGRRILLLIDLPGLQVGKLLVADVFQHQRLCAVTDHDPFTGMKLQLGHTCPPDAPRMCGRQRDNAGKPIPLPG
jgi:hypothetical protein